jgi:hypothetical protein
MFSADTNGRMSAKCIIPRLIFHHGFGRKTAILGFHVRKVMKAGHYNLATVAFSLLAAVSTPAAVFYVNVNSTNPVAPYSTWATAATAIQDAAGLATSGDFVWVTNGVYQTGGLKENIPDITNRVVITNAVTVQSINGPLVTVIQGYQPPAVSNAMSAVRCALVQSGGILGGFTLTGGQAGQGNFVNGGGVMGFGAGLVSNCIITGNRSAGAGGGVYECTLVNCLLTSNTAVAGGGIGSATAYNCTIVGNNATNYGGGVYGGNTYNSIVYYNTAATAGTSNYDFAKLSYSCTSPAASGTSNITPAPAFVNLAGGDFHLQIGSPCIDTGLNGLAETPNDLDGNPRIVDSTVDMGAYENQNTATVHYVSLTSTNPVAPYTVWSTAATNIQDAIGAAQAGEIVLASNGIYNLGGTTNRVSITNPVTVLAYAGPHGTTISGGSQMRCVYVGTNALLSGFTLTGGMSQNNGAGAWCEASGVVSNCVFTGNVVLNGDGGGVFGGTVWSSVLSSNSATYGGGGAFASLINCTIVTNSAVGDHGGGAYESVVSNCTVVSNWAYSGGGGVSLSMVYNSTVTSNLSSLGAGGAEMSTSHGCVFTGNHGGVGGGTSTGTNFNCTITGNQAATGGGTYNSTNYDCLISSNTATVGVGGGAWDGTLYNCILLGNQATNTAASEGEGGGSYQSLLVNCTVVNNLAANAGGGAYGGMLDNCIVYYNSAPTGSNWYGNNPAYCCTVPPGLQAGNFFDFSNAPVFVNLAAGDLHQQTNSPTINGGNNTYLNAYAAANPALLTNDFDGNPRIVGGTVDLGAYEYQGSDLGLPIPIPWLIQYDLPTDGSADYVDSDGDGMNNWQEWIAGTDPTKPSSVLKMLVPAPTNNPPGLVVTWASVPNRTYDVQRATGFTFPAVFQLQAANVAGRIGTTSWTDTNATGPGPFFYRVEVNSP